MALPFSHAQSAGGSAALHLDTAGYSQATTQLKDIYGGYIVEGSVAHGGLQPNYIIDTESPLLRTYLSHAASLKTLPPNERISAVIDYIRHEVILDRDQEGAKYMSLMAKYRERGLNIPLSAYVEAQVGVCREHAMLLHLALKEAGIASRYAYGRVGFLHYPAVDHAFVVITAKGGTQYIVDAYNLNLNGRKLSDVTRPGGSQVTDAVTSYAGQLRGLLSSAFAIHVKLVDYPKVWAPVSLAYQQ